MMADPVRSLDVDDPDGESDQSNKMLIVKILSEMHSTFNKAEPCIETKDDESKASFDNDIHEQPKSPAEDSSSIVFEAQPVIEEDDEPKVYENQTEIQSETCPHNVDAEKPEQETVNIENVQTEALPEENVLESDAKVQQNQTQPLENAIENELPNENTEDAKEPSEEPIVTEISETLPTNNVLQDDHVPSKENGSTEDEQKSEIDEELGGLSEESAETLKRKSDDAAQCEASKPTLLEEPYEKRSRMSLRNAEKAEQDVAIKRSSRRMSKDFTRESVLQNAIARKEKSLCSFSSEEKPRRSSRFSDDAKAPPPQRAPKSKISTKTCTPPRDDGYNHLNGSDSLPSSPIRGGKPQYEGDVEDTSSDRSSASMKKTRRSELPVKNCKSKENLGTDEDSANSWHAQPTAELPSEKVVGRRKKSHSMKMVEACEPPPLKDDKELPPSSAALALLCECELMTAMFPREELNQLCRALDVYENRIVKCANQVDDCPLLRSCNAKPFQALCSIHFQRMIRHNCCPTCGTFCTQGVVNICENKHLFHKDCDLKLEESLVCPHCGTDTYALYKIQLANHQYPLFLPSTKPLSKLPVARMSFSRQVSKKEIETVEDELSEVLPTCTFTLPNGRVVTTVGMPLPEQERLEYIIQHSGEGNDVRYTYRNLYQSAKNGDAEKVLALLRAGMSPNQPSMNPLLGAVREGHLLVAHLLVQGGANLETLDKNQFTPLMLAVQYKHNNLVKYLVKAGAAVGFKGADGMTALHIAAKEGNLEACHYIMTLANLPPSFIDTVDDGRWTALVWAAENCHSKIVRYLLEKRADPQIRDAEMNNALHWSAFSGSMETTEDLLNYGCSINLCNTHGDTPLHIAARQAADSCVVLLLARGAHVDITNKAGQLPRDCVLNKESYCYTAIELNMIIKKSLSDKSLLPRILCNDVSGGREENPIQCVNSIDDEVMPTDYTYVTENCFTSNITIDRRISSLMSCKCEDNCCNSSCTCTKISRGCWYDNVGKLIPEFSFEDPPMLFECNPACGCNVLTCKNRVVQKGLKSRLQLCKTKDKSWGVITLKEIPKGSYVCEYIGEIISDLEADTREDDSYLFDLDNAESETYCLDARKYGNICRFINHSCRPNLSPVKIYFQHQDLHFPRIAMFASRDIASNEELGFDYGEKFWIIKCKSFTCHCGEPTCRYSESTIQQTLEKYQQKLRELEEASDFACS